MALSLLAFTGTSTKDFLRVSNQVPPGGYVVFAAIVAVAVSFSVCARCSEQMLWRGYEEYGVHNPYICMYVRTWLIRRRASGELRGPWPLS